MLDKYREKAPAYFHSANLRLASRVTGERLHVLDVGCGTGALVEALNQRGIIEKSYGIEFFPAAASAAKEVMSEVWNESIEEFFPPLAPQSLDYVFCADVLEHLRDPAVVLARLKPLLKPTGQLLISLPNASNRRLIWNLVVKNEWQYAPSGIMDDTHLRWFTAKSAHRLIAEAGFKVLEFEYIFWGKGGAMVDKVSLGSLSRFVAAQLLFVAAPVDS